MQNAFYDNTTDFLAKAMDFSMRRHKVIAANMANIETPNYKAKDLPFNAQLKAALQGAERQPTSRMRFQNPMLVDDVTGETRFDGNNVNNENEMIKLIKNVGLNTMAADLIKYKFTTLREAMRSR
ncbi:MAG: flagellar basal body rod protein FlgB [Candidatus Poribacteria bacterium]|nr:flagellar basal body rod protein FlgB [Candidatus Poribacteria bacterium]